VGAVVDLVLLIAEPLRRGGPYDFGHTDLAARVNRARNDLVLHKGYRRGPPAGTLFLLRKFAGLYFLLNRLGARVDVGAVVAPFLPRRIAEAIRRPRAARRPQRAGGGAARQARRGAGPGLIHSWPRG